MMAGASRWLGGDGESGGDTQQGGQQYRHEDGLQCLAAGGAFEHVGQPENGTSMIRLQRKQRPLEFYEKAA